jgi:hypothetical protein
MLLFEHDLLGKPVPAFPDHALALLTRRDHFDTLRKGLMGDFDAKIMDRAGDTRDVEPHQLRLQRDPDQ